MRMVRQVAEQQMVMVSGAMDRSSVNEGGGEAGGEAEAGGRAADDDGEAGMPEGLSSFSCPGRTIKARRSPDTMASSSKESSMFSSMGLSSAMISSWSFIHASSTASGSSSLNSLSLSWRSFLISPDFNLRNLGIVAADKVTDTTIYHFV